MRVAFLCLLTACQGLHDADEAVVFLQKHKQIGRKAAVESSADKCACSGLGANSLLFEELIGMYGSRSPRQQFCRCALVGSSGTLKGKGLGDLIDSHDTVIRINRLPLPQHFKDFGNKTDIYFAEPGYGFGEPNYENHVNFFGDQNGGQFTIQSFENEVDGVRARTNCSLKYGGYDCNRFATLIMKGSDAVRFRKKGLPFKNRFPLNDPGWQPDQTAFPVGYQQNDVNRAVFRVLDAKQPSNGFHAFLTFAPLCGSMTLFGFDGSTTYDKHDMNPVHNLEKEHWIYDKLSQGDVSEINLKRYSPRNQLQSLAARGCIHRVNSTKAATLLQVESDSSDSSDEEQSSADEDKKVCFFVRSALRDRKGLGNEDGNQRLKAVTATWASLTTEESHIFYMVDEDAPPYRVPPKIKPWQVIPTPATNYEELPFRDKVMVQKLNSKNLISRCKWMALLDDDTYVDQAMVIEQLRWLDPKVPRIIVPVMDNITYKSSFAHTCFRLFSEAAVPIVADALEKCSKTWRGPEDADLLVCLQKLQLNKEVQLQQLNSNHSIVHGVDRNDEGQIESVFTMIGMRLSRNRCNSAMVVHKLLPGQMTTYHALIKDVPVCSAELSSVEY